MRLILILLLSACLQFLMADTMISSDFAESPSIDSISDFHTDRVAFHYFKSNPDTERKVEQDDSLATLVVILRGQLILLQDGFDSKESVEARKSDYTEKFLDYVHWRNILEATAKIKDPKPDKDLEVIFLRYDSRLNALQAAVKGTGRDLERLERAFGPDSPKTSDARLKAAEAKKAYDSRFAELKAASNAQNKEFVTYPGQEQSQNFFAESLDGNPDHLLYSRSPRRIEKESSDPKFVTQKYGDAYHSIVKILLEMHVDKLIYYATHRSMTNTNVDIQESPAKTIARLQSKDGKQTVQSEKVISKKAVVSSGDGTVYTLMDMDGDGQSESFYVESRGIPFHWNRNAPNVISITNCQDPQILGLIGKLLGELESGNFSKNVEELSYTVPEEQIIYRVPSILPKP